MIETRNGFQFDLERPFIRFKGPSPKSVAPPALPPPAKPLEDISAEAARFGQAEGRRLRKKTGRRATRLAHPELAGVPATVARAGLSTNLAGVAA